MLDKRARYFVPDQQNARNKIQNKILHSGYKLRADPTARLGVLHFIDTIKLKRSSTCHGKNLDGKAYSLSQAEMSSQASTEEHGVTNALL